MTQRHNRNLAILGLVSLLICAGYIVGTLSDRAQAQFIDPGGGATTTSESCTSDFFSEEEAVTTVSENIVFVGHGSSTGFVSRKVVLIADAGNGDDICVDLNGGTAVCPAADTPGDIRVTAGHAWTLDGVNTDSVSIIAAAGTDTIQVFACH